MNKTVIANFKMNKTVRETKEYMGELMHKLVSNVTVGFCPPFTALKSAATRAKGTELIVGAQNIHEMDKGAFTGDISAEMVKETGASFTLIGHSERRKYYKETNALVNAKILKALKVGLNIVLCVGETLQERNLEKTEQVLSTQVCEALKDVYGNELKCLTIAYEPVWAIGTGKVPTNKQIEEAMAIIRKNIAKLYSKETAEHMTILYGGSVDEKNSKEIAHIKGVDGALVGGAGLNAERFGSIIANFSL